MAAHPRPILLKARRQRPQSDRPTAPLMEALPAPLDPKLRRTHRAEPMAAAAPETFGELLPIAERPARAPGYGSRTIRAAPVVVRDIDESSGPAARSPARTAHAAAALCLCASPLRFAVCFYFADTRSSRILVQPLAHAFPPGQGKLIYTEALFGVLRRPQGFALPRRFFISFPGHCQPALGVCRAGALCARRRRRFCRS